MLIKTSQPLRAGPLNTVSQYLALVDNVPVGGFIPLSDFNELDDGDGVELDSETWLERFLIPEASPYRRDVKVVRYIHSATLSTHDLIWHGYTIGDDLEVAVIESVAFVLIRLNQVDTPLILSDDEQTTENITRLAERVLQHSGTYIDAMGQDLSYSLTFHYNPPLVDGSRFTSGPDRDPNILPNWVDRVDGGIHKGGLFFLGYKVHGSGDGRLIFLSGRDWFSGECWEAYS